MRRSIDATRETPRIRFCDVPSSSASCAWEENHFIRRSTIMDFKEFFEQNKKACIGGLAGAVVILMGIAVATSHSGGDSAVETAAASTEAAETTTVETAPVEVTRGDFYDKLNSGNAVNVLVLGDGFAYGDGATNLEDSWSEQLSQKLGDAFKSNVFVNNYALAGDNGAYAGFVIANELTTDVEYDAAVLSFGSYDDQDTFPAFYEALIRALNKKFPGIEIISLIEPSSVTNPDGPAAANADAIKNITSHYLGETIDIAKGFEDAGKDVKATVAKDQINQNDEGNDITSDVILSAIQASAAAGDQKGESQTIQPLDEKIAELESFAYIPASNFAKLNDTTYEILADYVTDAEGNKLQGLLGLDYDYLTGDNDVYVSVDGQPFGRHTVKFDGAESEQHIVLINDNFSSADHVTVKFATKEEADTFAGMSICGNIALPESFDKFETMAADDELSAEDLLAAVEETNADGTPVLQQGGVMEEGDIAEGGPGSAVVEGGVLAPQETVPETTKYETTNPTRYNSEGVLEEKYNGEWYEVELDPVTDPTAGVYAAGVDHPGAQPVTIVGKNAKRKSKAAGPAGDTEETTVSSAAAAAAANGTTATQAAAGTAGTETAAQTTAAAADASSFANPGAQVKAAGDYNINETDANGKVIASNGRLSISSGDDDE